MVPYQGGKGVPISENWLKLVILDSGIVSIFLPNPDDELIHGSWILRMNKPPSDTQAERKFWKETKAEAMDGAEEGLSFPLPLRR